MATTTNFGWETPDDTDLVKDGALAIRTLGSAIDTSLVDLKGGTTGQVLSKTSNTDMDFTWVTSDDANAIQNAIVDAKGDLIAASAADTPARLAVGNNGETLVADSSASTGLRWQGNFAAGKNKIINGDFQIWQRGTSFSNPSSDAYNADRFKLSYDGTGATRTVSQQTFTAGAAPVAGYEGTYFYRCATTVAGTGNTLIWMKQFIEDVRTFAGQTVTLSFWAKADTSRTLPNIGFEQYFGSGGSASVYADTANVAITSSWARYSVTVTLASISGKTLGAGNALIAFIKFPTGVATIDIWGVQAEIGNTATAFQTATGTLAGELAACQRYYEKSYAQASAPGAVSTDGLIASTVLSATSGSYWLYVPHKVTKRSAPTVTIYGYSGGSGKVSNDASGVDQAANSGAAKHIGENGFAVYNNSGGTVTTSGATVFHYVSSAEL